MSAAGKQYVISLQPYLSTRLSPVVISAVDRDGVYYRPLPVDEVELCSIGISQIIRRNPEIIDVRRAAGLVDPKIAVKTEPDVAGYMDIGNTDGIPYQGNCVLIIRIPEQVRTNLYQLYFDFGINSVNVSMVTRGIIDSYYNSNNSYDLSLIFLTDEQRKEGETYIAFIADCKTSAENRIQEICKKHVAFGTHIIILYKN